MTKAKCDDELPFRIGPALVNSHQPALNLNQLNPMIIFSSPTFENVFSETFRQTVGGNNNVKLVVRKYAQFGMVSGSIEERAAKGVKNLENLLREGEENREGSMLVCLKN